MWGNSLAEFLQVREGQNPKIRSPRLLLNGVLTNLKRGFAGVVDVYFPELGKSLCMGNGEYVIFSPDPEANQSKETHQRH